ncbi:hypothetical protein ACHAAC_06815 [Aeromicrobium sp. CF4.19]|uniref:hypothetical protein n=1 Tax=Aeromicrobium sp. CF4.19 TaxID=3373082 RepID=UPI003EE5478E
MIDEGEQPLLVLAGSPLLGPLVWEPAASVLRARGHDVRVASTRGRDVLTSPDDALEDLLVDVPKDRDVTLVAHSNAGLLAPLVAERRRVTGLVLVDAGLPEGGRCPMAPAALLETVAPLADEAGMLPGWTQWWPDDDVAPLFPPGPIRWEVEAVQPRVTLGYLRSTIDVPLDWTDTLPGAYLAFGDTYAAELERAEALGWPTTRLDGGHLHQLIEPDTVASQISTLARAVAADQ